jgi:serine protease DegS
MSKNSLSSVTSTAIKAGLVAGLLVFIAAYFWPDLLPVKRPVVEIRQSDHAVTGSGLGSGPVSYADAVEKAAPAVVNIYTRKLVTQRDPLAENPLLRYFFGQSVPRNRQRVQNSLGSGVIFSSDGYILTNDHVVAGADEIEVLMHDGRSAQAEVIGTDPESDLAVLRIALKELPTITVSSAEGVRVGDVVLAIGNPFGVGQTVTMGIIGATGRRDLGLNTFENFIQTDAAINPGNSGGALINAHGQLVGINTAIFSRSGGSQGIGFAIPVSLAQNVLGQIIEHGRAVRGWLGIEIQGITPELAESFQLPSSNGVIIAGVVTDGPADKAGLERGDILYTIGKSEVTDVKSALTAIAAHAPGESLQLSLTRNGEDHIVIVTVGERPTRR